MPTYNRPRQTLLALQSVRRQAPVPDVEVEIVLVDDASTVVLPADVSRLADQVIRLARNSGAGAARNAGIAASAGELLAFLDSDDVWLPNKLRVQLSEYRRALAEGREKDKLVSCTGFLTQSLRRKEFFGRVPHSSDGFEDFLSGCWYSPGTTLLAHRSVFETVGGFDPALRRLEDVDWGIRFAVRGGVVQATPELCTIIRPSRGNTSNVVKPAVDVIMRKATRGAYGELSPRQLRILKAYLKLEMAAADITSRRYLRGAYNLGRSLALVPRATLAIKAFSSSRALAADETSASTLDMEMQR